MEQATIHNGSLTTTIELSPSVVLLMPTKHMGNLLVALHSLQTIAKASQGHSLLVVDESYRDIIESVADIGKVLYYPRRPLKTASLALKAKLLYHFYRQLRQHQGKLLLDFDGQGQATTISQLSGIKERIGPIGARRHKGVYTRQLMDTPFLSHRFNDYAQYLTAVLGQTAQPQYPPLSDSPHNRKDLQAKLAQHNIEPCKPFACIHVGATKTYKHWPIEHYANITDWIAEQGIQVIFTGAGQSDAERIHQVKALCERSHHNLCDQLSIRQLTSLFQKCQFFLGNDSGPTHLAAASGTDVYAIFGPTDEKRWGPLGHNSFVIRNPVACENSCSKKFCSANHRCINTLSVEQVKTALQKYAA